MNFFETPPIHTLESFIFLFLFLFQFLIVHEQFYFRSNIYTVLNFLVLETSRCLISEKMKQTQTVVTYVTILLIVVSLAAAEPKKSKGKQFDRIIKVNDNALTERQWKYPF